MTDVFERAARRLETERELADLRRENDAMRRLLADLRNARPLLLYGAAWIVDIEAVLSGQDYQGLDDGAKSQE